jgi:hypothetical protein
MTQQRIPNSRFSDKFLLLFSPKRWPAVQKFRYFMGPPYTVNRELVTGTRGAEGHRQKFFVLAGLANRLQETLAEDLTELDQNGHTPASRSREFAALTETLICELYSCLDGIRRVLFSAYKGIRGVQNESTERLFVRAYTNAYGSEFPQEIRIRLATSYATWFPQLCRIRTELTHGDVGSCHLDPKTGVITYLHRNLGTASQAFVINDIIGEANGFAQSVFELMETIFGYLYAKLSPVERQLPCGFYKGRLYERYVAPGPGLSFASGRCFSRVWFEKESGCACPIRHRCGAYRQVRGSGALCT